MSDVAPHHRPTESISSIRIPIIGMPPLSADSRWTPRELSIILEETEDEDEGNVSMADIILDILQDADFIRAVVLTCLIVITVELLFFSISV
ncbi:hypothetical protein EYR36_010670 [Pleurotus pulmonarius]|nr:hypothetical protein EYR36_010670 [Pleurotus pulmonarius]KAF4590575.1 hypothetical protein EYR38_009877 [Pleurotus pulmonarius]